MHPKRKAGKGARKAGASKKLSKAGKAAGKASRKIQASRKAKPRKHGIPNGGSFGG